MLRRFFGPAIAGALAVSISACDADRSSSPDSARASTEVAAPAAPVEIGEPLFKPADVPPRPAVAALAAADPIVVRQCQVTLSETQNVPSKNSGRLMHFCTEILPGDIVPNDQIVERERPVPPTIVKFRRTKEGDKEIQPGEVVPPDQIIERERPNPPTKVKYRRLKEGDVVKAGQLLGYLDDKLAIAQFAIEEAAVTANRAKLEAAKQLRNSYFAEYDMYYKLWQKGAGSESDARRANAQYDKSVADVADAEGQLLKAREDLNKARVVLDEHEIRSTIGGTINRFYRKPGESIRELDPLAEVQNLSQLRVEGLLDVQNRPLLAQQMKANGRAVKVVVEAAPQTGAVQELLGHLQPVRAVAVTKDPKRPLIVSAGEDRTVRVWDRLEGQKAVLPHNVAVRSVACTPPTAEGNLCLTGADDGIARIWDLDSPEPAKASRELKGRHQARIVSVAFAPDGKTCVTADEREICLWDVASGEMKYRFPPQHRGQITYVQYTPQARLISEARDHSLCIWKLGEKGAAVAKEIDYRSGDVPVLGASPDGRSVLFDQDRALHVLSADESGAPRTEGVLPAPSDASQFANFALFTPDGKMVLAGGTADNPLQLWKAPAPGARAHMIRRLAVGANSSPTCAAFAPDGSFAVTGTQDHKVMVWKLPTEAEAKQELAGTLSFASWAMDPADRKVRIWADVPNISGDRLLAGESVTLVVPPTEAK
jgi:WD40 repeat protein